MTSRDHGALKIEAKRAFDSHTVDWKSLHLCMNPGRGRAWLDGVPEPQADGTVVEPGVTCSRNSGPWQCDLGLARRLALTAEVGGRQQPFDLYLPSKLDVEAARRLLRRAIELARRLPANPMCGVPAAQAQKWAADEMGWEEDIRLLPPEVPVDASISEEEGTTTVSFGGLTFDFAGVSGEVDAREFKCWGMAVIVT